MNGPSMAGMAGALIAGYAYIPQINHLIREHCSAGVSRSAFALWFVSSLLVTINAVYIHSVTFIVLGSAQIVATGLIYFYSTRYKNMACPYHAAEHGSLSVARTKRSKS